MDNISMRNPMLVHRIQDNLMKVNDLSRLGVAIIAYRTLAMESLINIIADQAKDNYVAVLELIGVETMEMIEEYLRPD